MLFIFTSQGLCAPGPSQRQPSWCSAGRSQVHQVSFFTSLLVCLICAPHLWPGYVCFAVSVGWGIDIVFLWLQLALAGQGRLEQQQCRCAHRLSGSRKQVAVCPASTVDKPTCLSCCYHHHPAVTTTTTTTTYPPPVLPSSPPCSNRKKFIEGYLRAATCLVKLGCLTAADRVLDKVGW